MESKLFNIGDIVALKSHPYFASGTNVILSADHLMLSPLMVISEVHKSSYTYNGKKVKTYKYQCTWFSTKAYKFIPKEFEESDLKLVKSSTATINKNQLVRGQKIAFKTMGLELGKKKSSLSYDDTSHAENSGSSTINSLLTFLPPVLQIIDYTSHQTKHKLIDKSNVEIRKVVAVDVKLGFYHPDDEKFQDVTLPLELLELLPAFDEKQLKLLEVAIKIGRHLIITQTDKKTILKPRNLAYRSGHYFLRGYDLLSNKIEEISLDEKILIKSIKNPILATAPKFDIATNPIAATTKFIEKEIITLLNLSKAIKSFIRIKYKSRNEKISHRTIKAYDVINVKEGSLDINYLVGYCMLRHDKRSFRIDRIQNLEQLDLNY